MPELPWHYPAGTDTSYFDPADDFQEEPVLSDWSSMVLPIPLRTMSSSGWRPQMQRHDAIP